MHIDPNNTWRKVEERLATEMQPKRRRNLETVLAHMKAEAAGDLDGLMATITLRETPHYHAYGTDDPVLSPRGRDAVRQFYTAFVASGAVKLELDVDRLVVDDDVVVTEGVMKMAYPGNLLRLLGHAVDDESAFYLFQTRMCILWPMDAEGKVIAEDSYAGGDGFAGIAERKLAREISRTNERLVWRSTCRGVVVSKGSRREHGMDQLDQGFDGEWFLEKRYLIRADSIGFAVLCRQARHQDHAERSLQSQGPLDDFMTMDSWIRISG